MIGNGMKIKVETLSGKGRIAQLIIWMLCIFGSDSVTIRA
jgi:hypothetical protein